MESVKIGVLTSGGDAQGMNAIVRAVVRTALHEGARPFAIREGWKGAVEGGDLIQEMSWSDVSDILHRGGTIIGTARSDRFREREGMREAVKNLVSLGIDRLISIGGDGTLTGTDELRAEWPSLLAELVEMGEIEQDTADRHPLLHIAGVVGSIDNDLVGTDMTVGADSALHRIIDAIDAISSTAESHRRSFVIEVMGRHCGYLALMSAIAGGCDYVFVPERPPADGWETDMCRVLKEGRDAGRRDSIIIVAEGATDRNGVAITSERVKAVLEEGLGESARVTMLGHVQRGGSPSAYDRWMPTLLGYSAALELLQSDGDPVIIGTRRNRLVRLPLMSSVENTRAVKKYTAAGDFEAAVAARGSSYTEMLDVFTTLASPVPTKKNGGPRGRIAIVHVGGLAPGMNVAARAAVRFGIDRGYEMVGIEGGLPGLVHGDLVPLSWSDVEAWSGLGGAQLGTRRTIPSVDEFYDMGRVLEDNRIDGLLIIGGLKGYEAAERMREERQRFSAFRIPIMCVPASIDNNLPASELSIGTDTALNTNVEVLNRIKQSASASRRCFVSETMGRNCGYLALMSGIASGAEQIYLSETGITLNQLAKDTDVMVDAFKNGRSLYLVVRNEYASENYTTDFLARIFEEEGGGLFDVRQAVIGHQQQGGNPSPFDRLLAVRLVNAAMRTLDETMSNGRDDCSYVGMAKGSIECHPLSHLEEHWDPATRLPYNQWWLGLQDVAYIVSNPHHHGPAHVLPILEDV
ncbi:6-phosphofructokinase [Flaviflexus equikiangi]|uniref:6-phosphofructokinase n=1 Tax=Flaviflexus equikiangi TaxID=2758573 RepID=UPI0015F4F9C8|nr:6-phosphofructokinase [Flaviflexus equikiangi]